MENIRITEMTIKDWPEVCRIYKAGIATKNATFEKHVPDWQKWDNAHRKDCRLVAKSGDLILGWAALSNISGRCVYSGVAEVSVYVNGINGGKGIGNLLMIELIEKSEKAGIWTLQAGIFPENSPSIKLHEKHGFRLLGIRERIGKMDDIWRDVAFYERRSKLVGIN